MQLDHSRTAVTDSNGIYRFDEVAEGMHKVELNLDELMADYSPAPDEPAPALVKTRSVARVDLGIIRTGSFIRGQVQGLLPEDKGTIRLDTTVFNLSPGGAYTTCDNTGEFAFHNLTEGTYEVSLVTNSLPQGYVPGSAGAVTVNVSQAAVRAVVFRIEKSMRILPVRQTFHGVNIEEQQ